MSDKCFPERPEMFNAFVSNNIVGWVRTQIKHESQQCLEIASGCYRSIQSWPTLQKRPHDVIHILFTSFNCDVDKLHVLCYRVSNEYNSVVRLLLIGVGLYSLTQTKFRGRL